VNCPVCNCSELVMRAEKRKIGDKFIGFSEIDEIIWQCAECKEEWGDEKNDDFYNAGIKELLKTGVPGMIESLKSNGITQANFERCLRIPQRTMARWSRGEISDAAVALMKLILTFPWLLEVADADFDAREVVVYKRLK
jgi:DNA-binding transcriptional regulator YiaG